ncbi:hypothetical protein AAX26_01747 [Aliarcobacter thereius]|uniref:Uncharacterized protein n=1 Tax=Aliarcobacter thereius TaxID=544718 RepID=A0A5R9GWV7_9BACT|nr:hypothetical protein [Aliarcobacter thereius]OCL86091.1 hypothetical protein AAX26_01747 [Aliarcobacter thereius]TLS71137.1 hypothetical protein FE246_09265 [Aliarcobacter thereius]TLT06741.1 hypothetical protein FE243_07540 [Aliarcobacter thereius]
MLKSLNNNYINSKIKTKIELFLLPILIIVFLIITYENFIKEESENETNELYKLINKKNSEELIKISKQIEQIALKDEVFIKKIENSKDEIRVIAKSSNYKLISFLEDIERFNDFSKINIFSLSKKDSEYFIDFNIDLSKYYIKKYENKIILDHKKIEKTNKHKKDIEKSPTLFAIVGDFVFIDDMWIKDKDKFYNFRVNVIDKNIVWLEDKDSKIELKVHKNEYLKD